MALLAVAVVWTWGYRALYPLLLLSCTQNLCVPLLYTAGVAGADAARALILLKEILLFALFAYAAWRLLGRGVRISASLAILMLLTLWCCLRGFVGVVQGEEIAPAGRLVRTVCAPLQIFVVGLAAAHEPGMAEKFLRRVVPIFAVLAVAAVALFFSVGSDFWVRSVNIAGYNIELKGEDPAEQVEDFGVSGTGRGRPEFAFLSEFRAVGTFGDPISLAFSMAFAILLASSCRLRWKALLLLPIIVALVLSFTRSSWIFVIVALATILLRRRDYLLLAALLAALVPALLAPPISDFVVSSVEALGDPADQHAAGLRGFYALAWRDPGNLLGKGTAAAAQQIPESGYAFLLEHFGLPAYALFLLLQCTMFSQFSRVRAEYRELAQIGQGTVLATLLTMHTAHYAFSFIGYLTIWFAWGALTGFVALERSQQVAKLPAATHVPA